MFPLGVCLRAELVAACLDVLRGIASACVCAGFWVAVDSSPVRRVPVAGSNYANWRISRARASPRPALGRQAEAPLRSVSGRF